MDDMNILFLSGVTQAGKSTTIRHSVQFLNVDETTKYKFLHPREFQNPPKILHVNGKIICVYLNSPQEARTDPDEAVEYLKDKIKRAQNKNADLLILAFNISYFQDEKTDACLNWINSQGYKQYGYFTYLDSNTALDVSARVRIESMRNDGFNILPTINRTTPDEQGKEFANYILQLL